MFITLNTGVKLLKSFIPIHRHVLLKRFRVVSSAYSIIFRVLLLDCFKFGGAGYLLESGLDRVGAKELGNTQPEARHLLKARQTSKKGELLELTHLKIAAS